MQAEISVKDIPFVQELMEDFHSLLKVVIRDGGADDDTRDMAYRLVEKYTEEGE